MRAVKLRLTRRVGKQLLVLLRQAGALPRHALRAVARTSRSATAPTGPTCCPPGSAGALRARRRGRSTAPDNRTPLQRGSTRVVFSRPMRRACRSPPCRAVSPAAASAPADAPAAGDADRLARLRRRAIAPHPRADGREGETVMRLLQRNVRGRDALRRRLRAGDRRRRRRPRGGRRVDWFYYVNGIEARVRRAARARVAAGRRVWWDHHDWSAAMRDPGRRRLVPGAVRHRPRGQELPVRLDCADDARRACDEVADAARGRGRDDGRRARASGSRAGSEVLRVLVGRWSEVRATPTARRLEEGRRSSGVFARPTRRRRRRSSCSTPTGAPCARSAPAPAWSPRRASRTSRRPGSSPAPTTSASPRPPRR